MGVRVVGVGGSSTRRERRERVKIDSGVARTDQSPHLKYRLYSTPPPHQSARARMRARFCIHTTARRTSPFTHIYTFIHTQNREHGAVHLSVRARTRTPSYNALLHLARPAPRPRPLRAATPAHAARLHPVRRPADRPAGRPTSPIFGPVSGRHQTPVRGAPPARRPPQPAAWRVEAGSRAGGEPARPARPGPARPAAADRNTPGRQASDVGRAASLGRG